LVVDDHTLVRKGIAALLGEIGGFEVIGEAADGYQAVSAAQALNPDVILIELVIPGLSAAEAIRQILATRPQTRILVLSNLSLEDQLLATVCAGAMGCLLKDAEPLELARAIRTLHRGEPWLMPTLARRILHAVSHPGDSRHVTGPKGADPLTDREATVLELLATGLGNRAIANRLGVSEATVRTHISHILGKLHLANRVQAVLYALKEGLPPPGGALRGPIPTRCPEPAGGTDAGAVTAVGSFGCRSAFGDRLPVPARTNGTSSRSIQPGRQGGSSL
jgi:NarL family two-component system response regulator LiaR